MEKALNNYLQKNEAHEITYFNPQRVYNIIIVIPCYNEPNICRALDSLKNAAKEQISALIIVVLNHGEHDISSALANDTSYDEMVSWTNDLPPYLSLGVIKAYDLKAKIAGVGTARKIGMDTACHIFGIDQLHRGVIACYDADSICAPNYITEITNSFEDQNTDAIAIKYEHPTSGDEFDPFNYQAIIQYEAHLRYFIQQQLMLKLPFAYHTVGSSMAVRASSYCKFGGMNRRKAGEDFYFMHRFVENGNVVNLNTTKVIPSPRKSDRVPFGTGKAICDMAYKKAPEFLTYDPRSFRLLDGFKEELDQIYLTRDLRYLDELQSATKDFFNQMNFKSVVLECIRQSPSLDVFNQRLYRQFNAFQLMKFLHFIRDHQYPNIPIKEACDAVYGEKTMIDHLLYLREIDTLN